MKNAVTIRLDDQLDEMLNRVSKNLRRNRSELIRDALRRQLTILIFEQLRSEALPFAEKKGYLTDDDIFREIT